MITCDACGQAIEGLTSFCGNCGAKLTITTEPDDSVSTNWQPNPDKPDDLKATYMKTKAVVPTDKTMASESPPKNTLIIGIVIGVILVAVVLLVTGIL
jgi:hypothetical protein